MCCQSHHHTVVLTASFITDAPMLLDCNIHTIFCMFSLIRLTSDQCILRGHLTADLILGILTQEV